MTGSVARRVGPPVLVALVVAAIAWAMAGIGWSPRADPKDTALLGLIGGSAAYALLVMLVGSRGWRLQGLGLMAVLSTEVLLWGGSWWHLERGTTFGEWEKNLLRAGFLVGDVLLDAGLTVWVVRTRFGTRTDPTDVPDDVRKELAELRAENASMRTALAVIGYGTEGAPT
jgi:hypothetical protein